MTTTDTTVQNLVINTLTKQEYEGIASPSDTEIYLVPDEGGELPSQTGNAGKFLTTDGTVTSWDTVDAFVIVDYTT